MTAQAAPVTFSVDQDRIGWIVFDAPASKANVLNAETQAAFERTLDEAAAAAVRSLVLIGAKERIFVAGADLRRIQELPGAAEAQAFSRRGQLLFQRLAAFGAPVVCAIHGACAGGGYELALACHWRIATDAAATRIGLPEVGIGTIPGWGGCVRLPRLLGAERALKHILGAQLYGAGEALRAGLVDEVVDAPSLRNKAKAAAMRFAEQPRIARVAPAAPAPGSFEAARGAWAARSRHLPAGIAAIDAVEQTLTLPIDVALEAEARSFGQVTAGEECKSLIHVFFLREAAKKRSLDGWFEVGRTPPASRPVRCVGIVGAGVMGSGIAHALAGQGFRVVLRDVDRTLVDRGLSVIRGLFDEGVQRGKTTPDEVNASLERIATTTAWEGFSDCDLVIEAIVEDVAAKQRLFTELAAVVRPDALLASNTSALPIEEIAGHVPNASRILGIHFFNPVSRMPLVELVLAATTGVEAAQRALDLIRTIGKSPVVCRSSPGFLVTRVLFFYLNAAVKLWEEGCSTRQIDTAMREFGWPMGPLRLIDEVGVDVTAFIFGEMAHYFPDRFVPTVACTCLSAAGLKGRKNGTSHGFYRYDGGREVLNEEETRRLVAAGASPVGEDVGSARDLKAAPAAEEIVRELMNMMVGEARRCLDEGVVRSADDADFALLSGAGFPAFRGGLLRWAGRARPTHMRNGLSAPVLRTE